MGTKSICIAATQLLICEFEMKLLSQNRFCIGLQILHLKDDNIFFPQIAYINQIFKRFNIIDAYSLLTPMVACSNKGDASLSPL